MLQQAKHTNLVVLEYFLKFQELIMTSNEALNVKIDKLLMEVEGLKKLLKKKDSATVEESKNRQGMTMMGMMEVTV